jgi:small-conductance mechanosensitive channel
MEPLELKIIINHDDKNSVNILGFCIFIFLISIFLYTIYLIMSTDLSGIYKFLLIVILLFSGPLTNFISFLIVLKNRDIKKCSTLKNMNA